MALPSRVRFATQELREEFNRLKHGNDDERRLHTSIVRAFAALSRDAFSGTQIAKRLTPAQYVRYDITNLWKYDLPDGWRLLNTVRSEEVVIVSMIIEWMSHKRYERRFKY
jgi:hypothetical protein